MDSIELDKQKIIDGLRIQETPVSASNTDCAHPEIQPRFVSHMFDGPTVVLMGYTCLKCKHTFDVCHACTATIGLPAFHVGGDKWHNS